MGAATRVITETRAVTERIAFPRRLFRPDVIYGKVGETMSRFVLIVDGLPNFNATINIVLIGFDWPVTVMLDVAEQIKKKKPSAPMLVAESGRKASGRVWARRR
ncbi:MAG: hypothetical protein WCD63_21505 [Terrimicrobiaceae bacterium]